MPIPDPARGISCQSGATMLLAPLYNHCDQYGRGSHLKTDNKKA